MWLVRQAMVYYGFHQPTETIVVIFENFALFAYIRYVSRLVKSSIAGTATYVVNIPEYYS